jgi:hypothetical protein
MNRPSRRAPGDLPAARAAIERFLGAAAQPVLLEPGEALLPLQDGNFALEERPGRLVFQAWDEHRNLSRRVTGVQSEGGGRVELAVERFGAGPGRVLLLDLARPSNQEWPRRSARMVFREQFRRMLLREFAGWRVAEISSEPDLEHSLSPAYARGLLVQGQRAMAAIGAPPKADSGGALSFGLIWLDYLRQRERRLVVEGLTLFAPAASAHPVGRRMRWLDSSKAALSLFAYADEGLATRIDLNDCGNLETALAPCRRAVCQSPYADRILAMGCVDAIPRSDGEVSFRVNGLEVARSRGGELLFGLHEKRPVGEHNFAEAGSLVRELAALREGGGELHRAAPELWLESRVRRELEIIDPALLPSPVYGQVPAFTGGDRGVLDLLAVDRGGRLAVIELKASADLHLPLQALDYWMRVQWHLERGEFRANGYFPGITLRSEPPRMLLISPVLEFHPTTETILGYFTPGIHVERIGLGLEWRRRMQVLFRRSGAERA